MNLIFIITTALVVSIDSFICGFSLAFKYSKKILIVLGISCTVLVLCLLASIIGDFLSTYFDEKISNVGGIILIFIGIYNLLSNKKQAELNTSSTTLKTSVLLGFGVGLDGAFATLSLRLMGITSILVPIIIFITHVLMVILGILLSKTKLLSIFRKFNFIPPVILIILGCYKILNIFI